MAEPEDTTDSGAPSEAHASRLQLVWDVLIFQFKLAFDGLRDLLLSPLSIMAGILGLFFGGDRPDRYFQRVLRFGRKTEVWINLFGNRSRPGTADELADGLKERVFTEARDNRWVNSAGTRLNRKLDDVNAAFSDIDKPRSDGR